MARAKDLGLTYPISDVPPLPTAKRNRLPGGRIVSAHPGGGMWLYRKVPMETMSAAKSEQDAFAAGQALFNAYNEVAGLSRAVGGNRGLSKSTYRETHLLWVNVPRFFDPQDHPNAAYLAAGFPDEVVNSRLLLFGVRLRDSLGVKQGFRASVKSVIEQVQNRTIPVEAFTADYEIVDAALRRAGLVELSAAEHRLSDAWWNHGRAPDTPVIPHMDHVHLFTDVEDLRLADDVGRSNCDEWEPAGVASTALTFASVGDFELEFADPVSYQAQWGIGLARQNAVAVSVRGYVEPAAVTRRVLRSNRRRYEADINERFQAGKMNKYEQEEHLAHLQAVEELYATGGTPTLVDSSTVVAFSGRVHDIELLSRSVPGVELQTLANRQVNAWAETWVSSTARGNPVLHELPIQTIAHAGFQSLSMVGDDPLDLSGTALVGFTEDDRQPAWVGASTASQKDSLPLMLVAGSTGSGKTMAMLWLASQWARQNVPVVICDPKTGSDHGPVVRAVGGQVHSLDELMEADGVFDPIRFAARPVDGVPTATSMLVGVNPWGSNRQDMERPLQVALAYGVQQGALCIGQALEFALRDGRASADMVDPVFEYADTEPMFRAMVGRNPSAEGLRLTSRLTYIKVGNVHLQLPQPGVDPMGFDVPLVEKVSAALVRMMVLGSAMAMTGRGGVVMLDEAWVFLSAGFAEVERLGRLARSQKVLPMLFTQRVTDAVNAGLTGFISRGLILPLEEAEARSACTLFNLEPTPERIGRIAAKDSTSGVPNPLSMKALWEGVGPKRRLIRGAVAIYADLEDRAVPVELRYPKDFLKAASTNPEDIARRDAALTFGSEPVMESVVEPDAGFGGFAPIPSAQEQSNSPEESFF